MATPRHGPVSSDLPQIRVLEAAQLPIALEPLTLMTPLEGEVIATSEAERFRLHTGELLVLRSGCAVRLERASSSLRVALFQVSPPWHAAFLALHGEEAMDAERPLERVPAIASLARRATQLFVTQRL